MKVLPILLLCLSLPFLSLAQKSDTLRTSNKNGEAVLAITKQVPKLSLIQKDFFTEKDDFGVKRLEKDSTIFLHADGRIKQKAYYSGEYQSKNVILYYEYDDQNVFKRIVQHYPRSGKESYFFGGDKGMELDLDQVTLYGKFGSTVSTNLLCISHKPGKNKTNFSGSKDWISAGSEEKELAKGDTLFAEVRCEVKEEMQHGELLFKSGKDLSFSIPVQVEGYHLNLDDFTDLPIALASAGEAFTKKENIIIHGGDPMIIMKIYDATHFEDSEPGSVISPIETLSLSQRSNKVDFSHLEAGAYMIIAFNLANSTNGNCKIILK